MHFTGVLLLLPALATCFPPSVSSPASSSFQHPVPDEFASHNNIHAAKWPSVHESAVAARRILKLQNLSTLSSVFPANTSTHASSSSNPHNPHAPHAAAEPYDISGAPIGLMDYHASCPSRPHSPLIIGVTIATTMRNAAAGSTVTLSMRYHLPSPASPPAPPRDDPWAYLAANLPRFSLLGRIERLDERTVREEGLADCFFSQHPDARIWAPGSKLEPHEAWWAVLNVDAVYWFGGFGDRARIGWLDLAVWEAVTEHEVDEYRLPGEPGWLDVHEAYRRMDNDGGANAREAAVEL